MTKTRKSAVAIVALLSAGCFAAGSVAYAFTDNRQNVSVAADQAQLTNIDGLVDNNTEKYFDSNVMYRLPETVKDDEEISVIISMSVDSVLDAYHSSPFSGEYAQFLKTERARAAAEKIDRQKRECLKELKASGIEYTLGESYDTLLSGFEITVKASDFDAVNEMFEVEGKSQVIVGERYYEAEAEVVTNDVDVYETGIFDSSECNYKGDGVVVAVLDTGCDYTHTAFATEPEVETEGFDKASISAIAPSTRAAELTPSLTGDDVYVSKKIPFAYDYADKDPDVAPINSNHGTHVAGIIAGSDNRITGVAPNAQLAIMKVFSDKQDGAKSSWILDGLEDCINLGVDVINMSLGSSCGFSRELDNDRKNQIYDKIKEEGISLIAAASNDYNATFGSEKNGNLGLTSNPDSGTVGAPSTYGASLSVASVDGVKTPYIKYGEDIIYFTEATNSAAKKKDFVNELLDTLEKNTGIKRDSYDFQYCTIPGIGQSSDYLETGDYYKDKIVLVKRGTSTFEDKVRVALLEKGAAGVIIYNNVSGSINMSVGHDMGAVCSITQDEGEMLAAAGTGTLHVDRSQVAGPFMSDFSSWGPTSDLKIKPEITAHGGEIESCVPGQGYDRLSGTSMAAPNQAGATALIRQYVKDETGIFGDLSAQEVTKRVNQLMMSTADIVYNKNGLAYSVRKQGAGLMNIMSAINTASYISTYEEVDGETVEMDKSKLELGDDKDKSGVYEMTFGVTNISGSPVAYDLDAIVMTEGVSTTYTSHGETTVTQDGYTLGAAFEVTSVNGGSLSGNTVTVNAGNTAKISLKITLTQADKEYLDASFANGMYVEGFITLKAQSGTQVNMSVPMLAFYGDWTKAPIFDEEYYDTNKDEIDAGIDQSDKLMPDAYATRVIGGLYTDYIGVLGSYYFIQDPSATQIAADKNKIALSNKEGTSYATLNKIRSVYAGLLRNCREVDITITDDATGETIFSRTEKGQMKSYSRGSTISASAVDVEFSALEHDLKNNSKYTVTLQAYIDYGENSDQKNERSTFTFPLYIDFEAPLVTGVEYRTEYDRTTKKTKLFADVSVYDNHYAMAVMFGQAIKSQDPHYLVALNNFNKYSTPVFSSFNSTSVVTLELTDYVPLIKQSRGLKHNEDGTIQIVENNNSFILTCYDYAMNCATYEVRLPDDITEMYFHSDGEPTDTINLSPNETLDLTTVLNVYPENNWVQTLDFVSEDSSVADVVNQTLIAKKSGTTTITATAHRADGTTSTASVTVNVLKEGDEGYVGNYSIPRVNRFALTSYHTNKAYYSVSSSEREIGETDSDNDFGNSYSLSMFPSESVTVKYSLDSYYDGTTVEFSVGNPNVATVNADGTIVAQAEGTTIVTASVVSDGRPTLYSQSINITVKDPYTTNSIYLMSYKGLGGHVVIPDDRGFTTIYSYAFSNYEYVDKDTDAGDIIDEEDPFYIKQMYIGEDTITEITIPEGVEEIQSYAFAKLTALTKVNMPSTLKKIGVGAFKECSKLKDINLENVQFINSEAFKDCALEKVNLSSVVAIGNNSFENNKALTSLTLPSTAQSIGDSAFRGNSLLASVQFSASKIKIAPYVFASCPALISVNINTAVLAAHAFEDCSKLKNVTLGRDVAVIGEYAFAGTAIEKFTVAAGNEVFETRSNGVDIYEKGSNKLVLRAPAAAASQKTITIDSEEIESGAFAGNTNILIVNAPNVKVVGDYAFANCYELHTLNMPKLEKIGARAFEHTKISVTPELDKVESIGEYAFAHTLLESVKVAENTAIGTGAFFACPNLREVEIGDGTQIGSGAFQNPLDDYRYEENDDGDNATAVFGTARYKTYTYYVNDENGYRRSMTFYRYDIKAGAHTSLLSVKIGNNVTIGNSAFSNNVYLSTLELGNGVKIGTSAFYNDIALTSADLSGVTSVGTKAFSGMVANDYYATVDSRGTSLIYNRARNFAYRGDEMYSTRYISTYFAPAITQANLSSATSVGSYAFAYGSLESVTLRDGLTEIKPYAFVMNVNLTGVTIPSSVTKIGDYAFSDCSLTGVDLSNVATIGNYAFAYNPLTQVTLKEGAKIGDYAFAESGGLSSAVNLEKATSIGARAFSGANLGKLDLSAATSIGDFAFEDAGVTEVKFGDGLVSLGENPFVGCAITGFGKLEKVQFNNVDKGERLNEDYDISENVKVIGGVLYQKTANGGLELVCYPVGREAANYTVVDGAVRISAKAFEGANNLESVTVSYSVKTIGDKAFYGCRKLALVVFTSYYAPILEEQFDEAYSDSSTNIPITGYYAGVKGLGISKYYMWTLSSSNNYYYGANFVDYIGKISDNIVVVRPANGQNYDTFIMSQYFATSISGAFAATDETRYVIGLIDALNDLSAITLADEQAVATARAQYEALVLTDDQKALVTNYSKLTSAESIIEYLKNRDNPNENPENPPADDGNGSKGINPTALIGYIIAGVALVALAMYIVITVLLKKNGAKDNAADETPESVPEDGAVADETAVETSGEGAAAEEAEEAQSVPEEGAAENAAESGEEYPQEGGDTTDEK